MDEREWKVGELAAATGLTVRTLRHFDQIGLLRPARRSAAGHRVYTAADVKRLYRILALRQLGMPLADIAASLAGTAGELGSAVRAQLSHVDHTITTQHHIRARLTALHRAIGQSAEPSVDQLIETMEALMQSSYFTEDQLAHTRQRHDKAGFAEAFAAWQHQATQISGALAAHLERDTDPADPAVQDLARQWTDLIHDMADGDRSIVSSLYAKIDGKGPETATRGVLTTEVWEYLKRAFAIGYGRH